MENKGKYYLTTAIAYTSAKPHIGNNYEIVLADSIARFKRKEGYDVFFQTGTDEHGQKIELKAEAAGITPKEHVDKIAGVIRGLCDLLNISYDKFIRTTDEDHEKQVQKIFKRLYDQGDIYKGAYEGMYCTPCESFWTESQLVDGKCPDCGGVVKPAKEEAYFFRMSKYADKLIKHINEHPEFIQPVSRKNEMMNNFLLPGLQDLCVSRTSFTWGIPVTFDPKHVIYVWLDALTNYITGIGYDADGNSTEQYKKLWPADLHLIGKDIIRFHTIYWPIFLMALGEPLPKQVFGHPWLLMGGGKMSKSKGNVVYADDLVDYFGVDDVHHRGLIGGAVRCEQRNAALLKGALIDAGLHRAVGREQARALHAALLQRIARERDHVQHGNGHGLADLLIVVVCGVAGHDEEIRADALEPLRALDHLRHGVLAAVKQRRRAVGNVRV